MTALPRSITVAAVCAAVAAGWLGTAAQAVPSSRPYFKHASFQVGLASEFDFEGGQYELHVVLANMGAGGRERICVSGVCRKVRAGNRVYVGAGWFGQIWTLGQTRTVVIAACNRAGCMRPQTRRLKVY